MSISIGKYGIITTEKVKILSKISVKMPMLLFLQSGIASIEFDKSNKNIFQSDDFIFLNANDEITIIPNSTECIILTLTFFDENICNILNIGKFSFKPHLQIITDDMVSLYVNNLFELVQMIKSI